MEELIKLLLGPFLMLIINYFAFYNQNQKRITQMETKLNHQQDEIKNLKEKLDRIDTKIEQKIDSIRNEIKNDINKLSSDIKSYIELIINKK